MLINRMMQNENGQAMTEFLICASFALVPLFFGISLLGKYIDIKQTAIQAARYEAWEYTVWFADNNEPMTGFDAVAQPIKSTTLTRNETRQRFFTDPGNSETTQPITSTDAITGWSASAANPLWVDHTGMALYAGVDGSDASLSSSNDTPSLPVVGDVIDTIFEVIDFAFSAIGSLMSFVGSSVGFTAINTEGYAISTVSMEVAVNPSFRRMDDTSKRISGMTDSTLNFTSRAAVVSDAWNAGGVEHTYNQAGGAVPTVLLGELLDAIPGFNTVWNIVTVLAPELRLCNPGGIWGADDKGSLWLGHIDIDAVHPDRLEDEDGNRGTHECNDAGICDFAPVVERSFDDDSRTCID